MVVCAQSAAPTVPRIQRNNETSFHLQLRHSPAVPDLVPKRAVGDAETVDSTIEAILPERLIAVLDDLRAKGRRPVVLLKITIAGGSGGFGKASVPHDDGHGRCACLFFFSGFLYRWGGPLIRVC